MSDLLEKKFRELRIASEEKRPSLLEASLEKQSMFGPAVQNNSADFEKSIAGALAKNDWIKQDGTIYDALNTGAELGAGTMRLAGQALSAPAVLKAKAHDMHIPDEVRAAGARKSQGSATAEDEALLALPSGWLKKKEYLNPMEREMMRHGGWESNEQRLNSSLASYDVADTIADNAKKDTWVDATNKNILSKEIQQDFAKNKAKFTGGVEAFKGGEFLSGALDVASSVAGSAVDIVGAGLNNKMAVTGAIANNAPQLAAAAIGGGAGLIGSNAAYGIDTYREGVEERRKANGGQLPSNAEMSDMAVKSAMAAGLEVVGDAASLGLAKVFKPGADALKGAGGAVAKDAKESLFKKALGFPGVGLAKATSTGALGEFATEAGQTYLEENVKGKVATPEQIFEGGAMGALVGGPMRAGSHIIFGSGEVQAKVAKNIGERVAASNEVKQAVADRNPDAFLDKNSESYDPKKAIQIIQAINSDKSVSAKEKDKNIEKAKTIAKDIRNDHAFIEDVADLRNPAEIEGNLITLNTIADELKQTIADPTTDAESKVSAEEELGNINRQVELMGLDDKTFNATQANAKKLADDSQAAFTKVNAREAVSFDVDTEINNIATSKADTEVAKGSAKKILNLAMTAPDRLDVAKVESLVSNKDAGLSESDRGYLQKWLDARKASSSLQSMGKVSKQILEGDKKEGFLGIESYRDSITKAINAGNFSQANKDSTQYKSFIDKHQSKAAAFNTAYEQATKDGSNYYPTRQKDGMWTVEDAPSKDGKSSNIHRGSGKFVAQVNTEAKALATSFNELKASYDIAKNATPSVAKKALKTGVTAKKDILSQPVIATAATAPSTPSPAAQAAVPTQPSVPATQEKKTAVQSPAPQKAAEPAKATTKPGTEKAPVQADVKATAKAQPEAVKPVTEAKQEVETKTETTPTEQVEEVQDSQAVETTQEVDKTEGGITVFKNFDKEASKQPIKDTYKAANKITQYFKQSVKSDKLTSVKPLASVSNFFSKWKNGEIKPSDFLTDTGHSEAQIAAVKHLFKKVREWNPKVESNYAVNDKQNADFVEDIFQDFYIDGKPVVDENITTAISYAAYSAVMDMASEPNFKTDDEILAMHGLSDMPVSADARKQMAKLYGHQGSLHTDLGKAVIQALGLKVRPNAPQDLMPKMETVLGMRAAALMQDIGVIEPIYIPVDSVNTLLGVDGAPSKASNKYYSIKRDKKNLELMNDVYQTNKYTKNIVDKIFGAEKAPLFASTEPTTFNQKVAKGTDQLVSKGLASTLDKSQNTPTTVIPKMLTMYDALGEEHVIISAGGKSPESVHAVNRDGQQAKWDGLKREYTLMMDMLNDPSNPNGVTSDFYIEHEVWRNFRVGIKTKSLNQQSSKIHRFAFQQPGWEVEVDLNNQEQLDRYFVAMAQNTGLVSTDKQNNAKTIEKFKDAVNNNSKFKAAVNAAINLNKNGKLNNAEREAISSFSAGAEGMMTLQALVSFAEYKEAKKAGKSSFKTTVLVGADGKTNGPMLTLLAFGVGLDAAQAYESLSMGGMYPNEDGQPKHFSQYFENGGKDLYQKTSANALRTIKERVHPNVVKAVESIMGTLMSEDGRVESAGRNLMKTPLTAFFFGSALNKSIQSMAEKFVEDVYTKIEKIQHSENRNEETRQIIHAMNIMLGYTALNVNTEYDVLFNNDLKTLGINPVDLQESFKRTFGEITQESMKNDFAQYIERRTDYTQVTNAAFSIYENTYTALRNLYYQDLIAKGEIATRTNTRGDVLPVHDMTVEQENKFREQFKGVLPIMDNAYSLEEGNLGAGIYMAKSKVAATENPIYKAKAKFANGYKSTTGKPSDTMNGSGYVYSESAPGVYGMSASIHSSDSFGMHQALGKNPSSLNVHDEGSNSIDNIANLAKDLNESVFNAFLEFSPMAQASNMLERLVVNSAKMIQDGLVPKSTAVDILASIAKVQSTKKNVVSPADALVAITNKAKVSAFLSDKVRLEVLSKMGVIDQYTWEGGQYNVTDANRKSAEDAAAKLTAKNSKEYDAAIAYLNATAEGKPTTEILQWEQELRDEALENTDEADPEFEVSRVEALATTEAFAPEVVDSLASVVPEVAPIKEAMDAGQSLVEAVNSQPKEERVAVAEKIKQVTKQIPAVISSPWGEIGTSTGHNEFLVHRLASNPNMGKAEVVKVLYNALKNNTEKRIPAVQMELLKALNGAIPNDVKVRFITADTKHDGEFVSPKSHAWFSNETNTVFILGPDFKNSLITPEVLLHELTHAALADAVQDVLDNPAKAKPEAKELVDNLTKLLEKARTKAKALGLDTQYASALQDVHEFIAWGMTNQGFQREVLNQFTTQANYTKNTLVKGMQAFVAAIRGFLFKGSKSSSQAITASGLNVLINNVAGLINEQQNRLSTIGTIANNAGKQTPLNLAMTAQDPAVVVNATDINDVFEHVISTETNANTEEFTTHLKGMVGSLSTQLLGSFGNLKAEMQRTGARTAEDIYLVNAQGNGWSTPDAFAAGLPFNQAETFVANQVQATMAAVASRKDVPASVGMREIQGVFSSVSKQLKPEHLLDLVNGNQQAAEDLHSNILSTDGDYISRFVALALSNEAFNNVLKTLEVEVKQKPNTWFDKVVNVFNAVLDFVNGKITKNNPKDPYNAQIRNLASYLVHSEHALRNKKIRQALQGEGTFEKTLNYANEKILAGVNAVGKSDLLLGSTNVAGKFAGNVLTTLTNEAKAKNIQNVLRTMRDTTMKSRDGFFATMLAEVKGPGQIFETLLRYAKNNERERMQVQDQIGKSLKDAFQDPIDNKTSKSITNVFLRTDSHTLDGRYTHNEINEMLKDPAKLDTAIADTIKSLPNTAYKAFYDGSSKALGYYMATGVVTSDHLLFNAHNIARAGGTKDQGQISEKHAASVEPTIDALATLYALKYTSAADKKAASQVLDTELSRGPQHNAVDYLVRVHRGMVNSSKAELFAGNEALVHKGYLPEITNPSISMITALASEVSELKKAGWVVGSAIFEDRRSGDTEKRYTLTRPDGGMPAHETGAISYAAMSSKGTETTYDNSADVKAMIRKTNLNAQRMYTMSFDPAKVKTVHAAPVLDNAGEITNYRYLMSSANRDNVLQRDNRFDKVMGALASNSMNKIDTPVQNRRMVEALKTQYDEESKNAMDTDAYIEFGPNSTDPFIKEHWAMLPAETKEDVKNIWGTKSMMIRADQFNLLFGSRMPSLANVFEIPEDQRKAHQQIFVSVMEGIFTGAHMIRTLDYYKSQDFGKYQTGYRLRQAEKAIQEVMKEVKSNIVIKNISVFMGNVSSNISLLVLAGVPLTEIVKQHRIAYLAAEDFSRDSSRKIELEQMIDNGYFPDGEANMKRELVRVTDSLERNPAKSLMDAGLMPTIVEDLDTSDDIYSYKSQLASKIEGVVNMVPEGVRNVGKEIYATKDSWYFQKMNRATQLSDFVARYTLIQHAMNRKRNPLSEADAIHYASEAFINYDLPSHRYLNYANSMGLVMFTKYYMRVQRMIMFLMKENPARALSMGLMHNYMNGLPILFDSFFPGRIGNNPFTVGVLNYPNSVSNILPIQLLTSPLR